MNSKTIDEFAGIRHTSIIENEFLQVELDPIYPVIRQTLYKPLGIVVKGLNKGLLPDFIVNGYAFPLDKIISTSPAVGVYVLEVPEKSICLTFSFNLEENIIVFRLEKVDESGDDKLKTIYFRNHSLVTVGPEWKYYRRRHTQRAWDAPYGMGLWFGHTDAGSVGAAIPDGGRNEAVSFACVWNDDLCITAHSSFLVKPMELILDETDLPDRASRASLQAGRYHYRAGEKVIGPLEFRLAFITDINHDGIPDYNDAAIWYRRQHPEPNPIYNESFMYKFRIVFPWEKYANFEQCLDFIKMVHLIGDGMPQIVYLVGWQYEGHDTGYPGLDVVNEWAGGRDKLLWLIEEAKKYNATVSCHINLDDAYKEFPAWDADIICRNPDGSLAKWEVFNNIQAYHISHTKDVRSGKLFKRLDGFLDLVPVEKSIHLDAFRFTNESWEEDGEHIGMVEELELGVKPILEYFRSKGIDPTCEAVGFCPADLTGLYSGGWYVGNPLLQFGKLIGGGRGDNLISWASGSATHTDFTPALGWDRVADVIYLGKRLYQLYLTRELMEYKSEDGIKLFMRLGDDGIVTADADADTMLVKWGDIEVARDYDRFIPVGDDLIYAYSRDEGNKTWKLPADWEGKKIEAITITPEGIIPEPVLKIDGRNISLFMKSRRPVRLRKIETVGMKDRTITAEERLEYNGRQHIEECRKESSYGLP